MENEPKEVVIEARVIQNTQEQGDDAPHLQPQTHLHGMLSAMVGEVEREMVHEARDIKEEIEEAKRLGFRGLAIAYFKKFAGKHEKRPPRYTEFIQQRYHLFKRKYHHYPSSQTYSRKFLPKENS